MSKMSRDELIQLMDLLTKYQEQINSEIYDMGTIDTKQKFATQILIQNHIKTIDEIKDAILFEF